MTARKALVAIAGAIRQIASGETLTLNAGVTGGAPLNVPQGSAPTSPNDGDVWTTTAGMFIRTGGKTVGPLSGRRVVQIQVSDPNAPAGLITGDGQAYFRVPAEMDGMNLVAVAATVTTASSSGAPTVQIANATDATDMLSTKLTIDASETDSATAATAAVIDTAHDDIATADLLRIDLDVAGTDTKGLIVTMAFQLP